MVSITDKDIGREVILRDGDHTTIRRRNSSPHFGRTYPYQLDNGVTITNSGRAGDPVTHDSGCDVIAFLDEAIADGNPPSDSPDRRHTVADAHRNLFLSYPQNVLRTLPAVAEDRKSRPVMSGCIDYFPLAIVAVAQISKAGNDQHNPGEPLHWTRGKSTDHADCVVRHLIERGTIDTDGQRHTAKAAWRVLALLQEELEAEAGWKPNAVIA